MREVIVGWIGKDVTVTLGVGGLAGAVPMSGTLVKASDSGVLLQLEKGQTYVPIASILHVSLLDSNRQ